MSINTTLQNELADNLGTKFDTGTLIIYAGAVPANANAALGGAIVKATHTFTGFSAATAGTIAGNAVSDETISGTGTQTVTFARLTEAGRILQLTVGTSGTQVIVASTSYTENGTSSITSVALTQPAT